MAAFLDGCRFNPTAGGTADWTYSSPVPGYQSPAAAHVVNGRVYKYRAESADLSQWELGEGAYNTATGVLARTTILFNSSGTTTAINFSSVPQIAIVALKEDLISIEEANSFTPAQKLQALSNLGLTPQCGRMSYVSATAIKFVPNNGDLIKINGSLYRIPAAGIAGVANTGVFVNGAPASNLAASTLYWVYAFINSGVVTADFSTTARATSSTAGNEGVEIKSGDDSRTLIGMVYTNASGQFQQTAAVIGVLSWFNRQNLTCAQGGSNVSTTSTTTINLGGAALFFMLNWAGDACEARIIGAVGTTGTWCQFGVGIDGVNGGAASLIGVAALNYNNVNNAVTSGGWTSPAEGLHAYWTALGAIPGGTAGVLNITGMGMTRG
jgi:hypothetical protein